MAPPDPPGASDAAWSTAFLSALVHELRTPLASLLLTAEVLAGDDSLDARQGRYARGMLAAGSDLRALLDDLGELNRLRAGRVEPALADVPLPDLRAAVESGCAELLAPAGGQLAVVASERALPVSVRTDQARVVRVVRQAAAAALAAGARRIELRLGAVADELRLELTDDGAPVASDEAAALFVPFAGSSARAQRPHGGHSLGLPLAAAIVARLGGRLTVASDAGGTRLTLALPLDAAGAASG
jgi:signal transduction histidine kinase